MDDAAKQARRLIVEDDEIDKEALVRCLTYPGSPFVLTTVNLALEALTLLRETWSAKTSGQPYVILLDLNLPGIDGFTFLRELRRDPQLSASVVFVLSSSILEEDRNRTHAYNIAGYIPKSSLNCNSFRSLLETFIG